MSIYACYVLVALVVLMLNEYRLIKKYIHAIENKKPTFHPFYMLLNKQAGLLKEWIHYKLLKNELN